jgi:cytidylate kinase
MAVVTISREYGSVGSEVARNVAELLGYHLIDKSTIGRILAGYGLIDFDSTYEVEAGIWSAFDSKLRTIVSMLERLSYAVARHGHSVLLGRGAYATLGGMEGVLNVRIRAPCEWRVSRIMEERGFSDRSLAESAVREGDKVRSSFLSSVYGIRWDSMEKFDLVIDTSKIGPALAASWIVAAASALPEPRAEGAKLGEADSVIDEAVATELGCKG